MTQKRNKYRAILEALEGRSLLSTLFVNSSTTSALQDGSQASPFSTIQAAINSAATAGGDVISIAPGTYAEALQINHPVTLQGPGTSGSEAVIVPPVNNPAAGVDILVEANDVTIEGLVIDGHSDALTGGTALNGVSVNAASGISNVDSFGKLYPISGLTVTSNLIRNFTEFGIIGDGGDPGAPTSVSTGNTISNNTIDNIPVVASAPVGTSQSRGISIEDNFYADITGNVLTQVATGIQAIFTILPSGTTAAAAISGNQVQDYDRGIFVYTQDTDTATFSLTNNTISTATGADATNVGIDVDRVLHATTVTLAGNNVSGASVGIQLDYDSTASGLTVTGGTLSGNTVGLLLTNANPVASVTGPKPCQAGLAGVTITGSTQAGLEINDTLGQAGTTVTLSVDAATSVTGSPHGAVLTGPGAALIDAGIPSVAFTATPKAFSNTSAVTFSVTESDNITALGDLAVSYTLDGNGPVALSPGGSISLTGLADGAHTLLVQATDQAGNKGSASYAWTVDTTPPTVGFTATPKAFSASNAATFAVSASDNITPASSLGLSYTLDSNGPVTLSPGASISLTGLADGAHTLLVQATDQAGNSGSASFAWNVDTTPPTVSFTATPRPISPSSTATFSVSASDNITPTSSLALSYTLDSNAPVTLSPGASLSLTGLADGAHTLLVQATDQAGNSSSATYAWTVDTTPPTVSFTATPKAFSASSAATFTVGVSDNITPASSLVLSYTLDGKAPVALAPGASSISLTGLADGAHTVLVQATDQAGNSRSTSYAWTVDTTPPTISITPAVKTGSSSAATFTVSASDNITPASSLGLSYTLDSNAPVALAPGASSISLTGLASGPHTLVVQATDQAGNTGSATYSWSVSSPTPVTAPSTPVLAPGSDTGASDHDGITNDNTPTFTGTAAPGVTVTLYANNHSIGTTVADSKGAWSFTPVIPLPDGAYAITATAASAGGSTSAASGALKIVVDTTPPTASLTAFALPAGLFDLSTTPIVIAGKVSSPLTKIASASYSVRDSSGHVLAHGSINILPDGTYRGLIALPGQGGITAKGLSGDTITLSVVDMAGNVNNVNTAVATPDAHPVLATLQSVGWNGCWYWKYDDRDRVRD
jgi:hypothetical protein